MHCGSDGSSTDAVRCVSTVANIELADNPLFDTDKLINEALLNIYSNTNLRSGVEPNLWKISFDQLNDAVDKGFGKVSFESPDFGFVQELKQNNGVFAAFKAYDQAEELRANLLDEKGKLKSFAKFKKDTAHIESKHKAYRKTEYNTAVKRARTAQQFNEFQKTAHLYPNIRWTESRAANPDALHRGFYGTVLPINDPFWQANFPGSRWGCKCGWEVTDDEPTSQPEAIPPPTPGLDQNPTTSKAIFTETHPVFNVANGKKISDKKKKAIAEVAALLMNKSSAYIPKVIRSYKNGGKVLQTLQVDVSAPDYSRVLQIAEFWAKQGDVTEITPNLTSINNSLYGIIYKKLKDTEYWQKNPDLRRNGVFYEHEGYRTKNMKNALKNMLNRGSGQSDKVVIEDCGHKDWYYRHRLQLFNNDKNNKHKINELWVLRQNGELSAIK